MNISKLVKLLLVSTAIFLASILITNPAFAKNITGGFVAGTKIATPNGSVVVEELKPGDRTIGYNFETHHPEENTVKAIDQKSSLSYYLINGKTKITGTNLVHVRTSANPKLIRLQQLKFKDKLYALDRSNIVIDSIEQIIELTNVYQVVLNNNQGNLYANDLLIHVGSEIPAYLKGKPINCQPGTPYYKQCPNINSLSGLVAAIITVLCIPLVGSFTANSILYIRNLIRFGDRDFTSKIDLITFTNSINPNFTNRYSLKYVEGNKVWYLIPLQPETEETEYQHLIEKQELIERINQLYIQYYRDLVNKNFSNIVHYFPYFANKNKYKNYRAYFSDKFDIIYQPKVLDLSIINLKTQTDRATFKVQINAEMTNFVISESGYVLTGKSKVQQYSEYWYVELTDDKQWRIKKIEDTLTTRIMSGDKRAKREAYGDFGAA